MTIKLDDMWGEKVEGLPEEEGEPEPEEPRPLTRKYQFPCDGKWYTLEEYERRMRLKAFA